MPKHERVYPKFVLLYDPTDSWPVGRVHDLLRLRKDIQAARSVSDEWWAEGCKFREHGRPGAQVLTLRGSALVDDAGRVAYQIENTPKRNGKPERAQRQDRAAEMFAGGMTYGQIAVVLECSKPAVSGLLHKWRAKHPEQV